MTNASMPQTITARILRNLAKAGCLGLEISANHDGSVGAVAWSDASVPTLDKLREIAVASGYVVVAQTGLGFSVAAPQDLAAVRSSNWQNQRPRWRG